MKNLEDRKKELVREYKKNECKLSEIFENSEKIQKYLRDFADSLKIILEKYLQCDTGTITLREVPLLYGLLSLALEGSIRLYFLSKQFDDFIGVEQPKRTLSKLKEKINKDILNEIGEKLDYLIFVRNHFIHFPLYYTSFYNDKQMFVDVIRFFAEKSGFPDVIPPRLLESRRRDSDEQR